MHVKEAMRAVGLGMQWAADWHSSVARSHLRRSQDIPFRLPGSCHRFDPATLISTKLMMAFVVHSGAAAGALALCLAAWLFCCLRKRCSAERQPPPSPIYITESEVIHAPILVEPHPLRTDALKVETMSCSCTPHLGKRHCVAVLLSSLGARCCSRQFATPGDCANAGENFSPTLAVQLHVLNQNVPMLA